MVRNIDVANAIAYVRTLDYKTREELHNRVLDQMSTLSVSVFVGRSKEYTINTTNVTGNVKAIRDWIDDSTAAQSHSLQAFEDGFREHLGDTSSSQTSSSSVTSSSSSSASSSQSP